MTSAEPSDRDQAPEGQPSTETVRAITYVRGRVQGVGFRWWTRTRALELGLVGHARNCDDGRVEVCAQGSRGDIGRLVELLVEDPSTHQRPGRVDGAQTMWVDPRPGVTGFEER